jgi:hypothetical protein
MSKRSMAVRVLATVVLVLAVTAGPSLASPTGLNNIPTADVVPLQLLVLQAWANTGNGETDWFAGFKYGPAENWEVGLDSALNGASTGLTAQAKYRIPLEHGMRAAVGLANISGDEERHGEVFPYAVLSAPLGAKANGHLGYAFQSGNQALFLGADATVNEKLTLRTDWTQTNDGHDSLWSLGFISPLSPKLLVEAWASFPTATGADSSLTVKLDYVIPLGH